MKTQSSRHPAGFTLVELLVVISIIAVLAAASFAVGLSAIQKAKKVTTLATCVAIEAAVNNFYTEYGSMPKSSLTADTEVVTSGASVDLGVLNALLGIETIPTPLNPRGIKFLSVREGKYLTATTGTNGLVYTPNSSPATIIGIYDPWGGPYRVALDGDYTESISVKPKAAAAAKILNGRRVAAYSNGADGVSGSVKGTTGDDVITW